jgi:hypothetical protein
MFLEGAFDTSNRVEYCISCPVRAVDPFERSAARIIGELTAGRAKAEKGLRLTIWYGI